MKTHQLDLVRDSFVTILFAQDRAAAAFYARLFELAPETRALFSADLAAQGRRLILALSRVVTGLGQFDAIRPVLRDLAVRHIGYGVEDRHYAIVGDALIAMVAELADGAFDPVTEAAWRDAYALVADEMLRATDEARRAAAA